MVLPLGAQAAPVGTGGLGRGRYARLRVVLEKTVFQFDVLSLDIRVDQATADRLERMVKGREYSSKLERDVVSTVLEAETVYTAAKFLRGFGRDAFVEGVRVDLGRAYKGELIDREEYLRVHRELPRWFAFLGDRGVRKGDWLYNRGDADGLRTVFVNGDGASLMDLTLPGRAPTRTLVACYLAPGGDLREPLVRSLFE